MAVVYTPVGTCPGCDSDVLNDADGRTIDPDGRVWHPECRKVEKRKQDGRRRKTAETQGQA